MTIATVKRFTSCLQHIELIQFGTASQILMKPSWWWGYPITKVARVAVVTYDSVQFILTPTDLVNIIKVIFLGTWASIERMVLILNQYNS